MKDRATWRMISNINSVNPTTVNEASLFLVKQVRPFLDVCPLTFPLSNNLNEIYNSLDRSIIKYCDFSGSYKFEAQYHIFHKHTGNYLTSLPLEYKSELQQIFFLGSYVKDEIEIVALVSNLTTFFAAFGIFCNFCKKQFKGKGTQHKCLLTQTCFSCRRPFRTRNTYCNTSLEKYFCDSAIKPLIAKECKKCHLVLGSPHCEKNHSQRVCRWGYFCAMCKRYTYHSKFTAQEQIQQNHDCSKRACYFCGENDISTRKHHLCRIQLPRKDKMYPNMAFLDIQITGSSPAICKDCFNCSSDACAAVMAATNLGDNGGVARIHQISIRNHGGISLVNVAGVDKEGWLIVAMTLPTAVFLFEEGPHVGLKRQYVGRSGRGTGVFIRTDSEIRV